MAKINLLTASVFLMAAAFTAPMARADDTANMAKVAAGTSIIEAQCTKSDVTLMSTFTLKCTDKPVHMKLPNGHVSLIFIAADDKGTKYNISFNGDDAAKPPAKQSVLQVSTVRFGPLSAPASWKSFPVTGTCTISLQDDAGQMVDHLDCTAATGNIAKFAFSTGPGAMHGLQ